MKKTITMLALCVLVAMLPFQAIAEGTNTTENRILPFWDMSWDDMEALYASNVTFKQEKVYVSAYKCLFNINLMSGNAFSGVLKPDNGYDPVYVWQRIGTMVMPYFDEMNQVTPSSGNLAAYEFINEETYMRIEYMETTAFSSFALKMKLKKRLATEEAASSCFQRNRMIRCSFSSLCA